jgi:hypothetical protein
VDYNNSGKLKEIFVKVVNEDLRELFDQISQPVFLYRGQEDDQIAAWQIAVMKEKISHLQFKSYP